MRKQGIGLLLVCINLGLSWVRADPKLGRPPPPPHPTVIVFEENGVSLPVVRVSGKTPLVFVDGKAKSLETKTGFAFGRAKGYGPGRIELIDMVGESSRVQPTDMRGIRNVGTVIDMGINVSVTLVPTQTYEDSFVALILYDKNYILGWSDEPYLAVFFRNAGRLVKGRKKSIFVDVDGDKVPGVPRPLLNYFFLVFSGGKEIESNQADIVGTFFRRGELIAHQKRLAKYIAEKSSEDSALQNYLMIRPDLRQGERLETLPDKINVTCTISSGGFVESVELSDSLPEFATKEIRRAASGWLFLPLMHNGRAQRTRVQVPINCREASIVD